MDQNGHRTIDLDELFGGELVVTLTIKDVGVRYHFIEKNSADDMEHVRRTAKIRVKGGQAVPTEMSLTADLWLFDRLCKKVEVFEHGAGSAEQGDWIDVPDFRERLRPDAKRAALNLYNERIKREQDEGEAGGN